MIEFHAEIRLAHLLAVLASGGLFLLRLLATLAGPRAKALANAVWLRLLATTVDATVLTAALMLATMLPEAMFGNGWLKVKLVAVACFLCVNWWSLADPAMLARHRVVAVVAVAAFGFAAATARAHHPLGAWFLLHS